MSKLLPCNDNVPFYVNTVEIWRKMISDRTDLCNLLLAYFDTVRTGENQNVSELSEMAQDLYNLVLPSIGSLLNKREKRVEKKNKDAYSGECNNANKDAYSGECNNANKDAYSGHKEEVKDKVKDKAKVKDKKGKEALSNARAKNTRDTRTRKETGQPPEHFSNSQESPLTKNNESVTGEEDNINAGHSDTGEIEENSFDTGVNSEEENHEDENGSPPGSVYHPEKPPEYPRDCVEVYKAAVNQGYHISPDETMKFFSNFTSAGWMDTNGNKIRDWTKLLLSWAKNQSPEQKEIGDRVYHKYTDSHNGGFLPDEILALSDVVDD